MVKLKASARKLKISSLTNFYFLITRKGQFLVGSLIGMIAFKIVTKARIGKFKRNISFLSVKVILAILLDCYITQ